LLFDRQFVAIGVLFGANGVAILAFVPVGALVR
jgi:hypothetical protein